MKRRYSNFHRARKYHRRYLRELLIGNGRIAFFYNEMYEKYDTYAYHNDGVSSSFINIGQANEKLVINRHFNPKKLIPEFALEFRNQLIGDMDKISPVCS